MRGSEVGGFSNILAAAELLPLGSWTREMGWRWLRDRVFGRARVLVANKSKKGHRQRNAISVVVGDLLYCGF